jgi:hypothetical protein
MKTTILFSASLLLAPLSKLTKDAVPLGGPLPGADKE